MAMKTRKSPTESVINAKTFQTELGSLANTLALKVQREAVKVVNPGFVATDIYVMLRQSISIYHLIFHLNADERREKEAAWTVYSAAALPLVRCMIDSLYNITAILTNPGVKGRQFRASGYRQILDGLDADEKRYGGAPSAFESASVRDRRAGPPAFSTALCVFHISITIDAIDPPTDSTNTEDKLVPRKLVYQMSLDFIHVAVLFFAASQCLIWSLKNPLPNISMLVLTAITVVMTVLDPNKVYKTCYLILVLWLAGVEYHAINKDHFETVAKDESRRKEQNDQFQTIAGDIQAGISKGADQFTTTMNASKRNLDLTRYSLNQITGDDQFCYLMPVTEVPDRNQWRMAVITSGKFPLLFCHVIIHRHFNAEESLRLMKTPEGQATVMSAVEKWFGPISPGKHGFSTDVFLDADKSYDIEIYTWNAQFSESLSIISDWVKKHASPYFIQVNGGPKWELLFHLP